MLTAFVRTVVLFGIIIFAMRLMGKRQIGQLQPSELVVTILLSEIAATPMQDNGIPLLNTVISLMLLTAFELLLSFISLKSARIREALQGNSLVIIRNGVIDCTQIRRLRYTIDDIQEALRQKDVFDISEVAYAVAETNGTLSVQLYADKRPLTAADAGLHPPDTGLPSTVIVDGEIIRGGFKDCGMTEEKLKKILFSLHKQVSDILLLSVDGAGTVVAYGRDGKRI